MQDFLWGNGWKRRILSRALQGSGSVAVIGAGSGSGSSSGSGVGSSCSPGYDSGSGLGSVVGSSSGGPGFPRRADGTRCLLGAGVVGGVQAPAVSCKRLWRDGGGLTRGVVHPLPKFLGPVLEHIRQGRRECRGRCPTSCSVYLKGVGSLHRCMALGMGCGAVVTAGKAALLREPGGEVFVHLVGVGGRGDEGLFDNPEGDGLFEQEGLKARDKLGEVGRVCGEGGLKA